LVSKAYANVMWAELLHKTGHCWLSVITGSMAPLIRPGDRVLVTSKDIEKIGIGDIVAFRRDDNIIVHRILHRKKNGMSIDFLEKGDATYFSRFISANDIIGKVTAQKSGSEILVFDSAGGRFASSVFGLFSDVTARTVSLFRSSRYRPLRIGGKFLSRVSLILSNMLIIPCYLIWYICGLSYGRDVRTEEGQPDHGFTKRD
jgi:signal peptidase I